MLASPVAFLQERFYRWALRGHPPEASPIRLTQRRIFVLPTRQGLAYAVSLLVMLIGAINYNLSLGHALVFLLAGLGATAILHTFRNLAYLQICPGRCEPVFAGEHARFGIVLANQRRESRPSVRLRLPGQVPVDVEIPGQASIEVGLELSTSSRGWLPLPRVTLETNYPLGLIRAWSYVAPDQRCLVYPSPASAAPPLPAMPGEGCGAAHQASGMEDFSGLRLHQPADPPRHVAWKSAARQTEGPLLTKQFSGAAAQTLWFDWEMLSAYGDTERCLSVMTRWICDAHAAGLTWGLRLPGKELAPASGNAHFHACLKLLALYE
ncbi:MAG: DUF58 domain-containing protein [Sterolibacterium sp.]|nr:DUF58 domain-containing protein [Sterolibacterium sp.]